MSANPTDERLQSARETWDAEAATFDNEPDHGLRDPAIRNAWLTLLRGWLPSKPAAILDIGCGTGTLSTLVAEQGHTVTGIDLSPAMIAQAQAKAAAAGQAIAFSVMDAANPQLAPGNFDLILCRHLLWALPKPRQVLARLGGALTAGGPPAVDRRLLAHGRRSTYAGRCGRAAGRSAQRVRSCRSATSPSCGAVSLPMNGMPSLQTGRNNEGQAASTCPTVPLLTPHACSARQTSPRPCAVSQVAVRRQPSSPHAWCVTAGHQ
ncbi:MAG: class I SAM-dependent methyltransferase [Caldilineaceae bacterium]